jgi:hypothetical protein
MSTSAILFGTVTAGSWILAIIRLRRVRSGDRRWLPLVISPVLVALGLPVAGEIVDASAMGPIAVLLIAFSTSLLLVGGSVALQLRHNTARGLDPDTAMARASEGMALGLFGVIFIGATVLLVVLISVVIAAAVHAS